MGLRRILSRRFPFNNRQTSQTLSHELTPTNNFRRDSLNRYLPERTINQSIRKPPAFLYAPVGERLREKLWPLAGDCPVAPPAERVLSASDVGKIWRSMQMEKLRSKLREINMNCIDYSEYVKICSEVCENHEQGLECAKMLDHAGTVIVTGRVVFLRPDQIAKSVEKLLYETMATPNDPRRLELKKLQKEKALIDVKAESLVRRELYCGLGYLIFQTIGFMRLTFWELSWDVMEPICFFVASIHFALAYGFFLRTSKEPTFESYFRRRFLVKQAKLMKAKKFDIDKYKQLCKVFCQSYNDDGDDI